MEDGLSFVEGMQFDRGYISPYFVTNPEKMVCEYDNPRILLVDKKISTAREVVSFLEVAIQHNFPLVIMAEEIEQEALATLVVNKLRGNLKVVALKAPGFGERKSQYLEDIAVLTGATVIKDELGITLQQADLSLLGQAAKIEIWKEYCTVVGNGSFQKDIEMRVSQIRHRITNIEQQYEKEKLNERIARLSGGVAIINVGAQTETELKEKKLRVEDALCATKAAIEEGIVVGGGCTFVKLSKEIAIIKETLANEEQKVGAEIVRKALLYPLKLISSNSGSNGTVVLQRVYDSPDPHFGYNASSGEFEDLMIAGIIDPTKVIRCALENASSVARTFLTANCIVCDKVRES